MFNVILPMAGDATRLPINMLSEKPKQCLSLPYEQTPLSLSLRPITRAFGYENIRYCGVIPSGEGIRNVWKKYFIKNYSHYNLTWQEKPNGSFGAVLWFLQHKADNDILSSPTFVVYPDTLQQLTESSLHCMVGATAWLTVAPKKWEGGDAVIVDGHYVADIVKQRENVGFSPAGLLYFHNTYELYGVLSYLSTQQESLNIIEVINHYRKHIDSVDCCFVPRIIDCGSTLGLAEAYNLANKTEGKYFW